MNEQERIRPEDMAQLQMADLQARLAAAESQKLQLRMFIKYRLTDADSFDISTGELRRAPIPAPHAASPEPSPAESSAG